MHSLVFRVAGYCYFIGLVFILSFDVAFAQNVSRLHLDGKSFLNAECVGVRDGALQFKVTDQTKDAAMDSVLYWSSGRQLDQRTSSYVVLVDGSVVQATLVSINESTLSFRSTLFENFSVETDKVIGVVFKAGNSELQQLMSEWKVESDSIDDVVYRENGDIVEGVINDWGPEIDYPQISGLTALEIEASGNSERITYSRIAAIRFSPALHASQSLPENHLRVSFANSSDLHAKSWTTSNKLATIELHCGLNLNAAESQKLASNLMEIIRVNPGSDSYELIDLPSLTTKSSSNKPAKKINKNFSAYEVRPPFQLTLNPSVDWNRLVGVCYLKKMPQVRPVVSDVLGTRFGLSEPERTMQIKLASQAANATPWMTTLNSKAKDIAVIDLELSASQEVNLEVIMADQFGARGDVVFEQLRWVR
jgi:hypothetical protein